MREMTVNEQRYRAVLAVISEGETVTDVADRFGVSRHAMNAWLTKFEAGDPDAPVGADHRDVI